MVGVKMKLIFLCVGDSPAVCKAHSKMQRMCLLGALGHALRKIHALRFNLVLSKVQNCYAKDKLCKSVVREISLAVHANFVILKLRIEGG